MAGMRFFEFRSGSVVSAEHKKIFDDLLKKTGELSKVYESIKPIKTRMDLDAQVAMSQKINAAESGFLTAERKFNQLPVNVQDECIEKQDVELAVSQLLESAEKAREVVWDLNMEKFGEGVYVVINVNALKECKEHYNAIKDHKEEKKQQPT